MMKICFIEEGNTLSVFHFERNLVPNLRGRINTGLPSEVFMRLMPSVNIDLGVKAIWGREIRRIKKSTDSCAILA